MTATHDPRPAGAQALDRYTGHLYRRAQQLHAALWSREVSDETTSVQFAALAVIDAEHEPSQRDLGAALDLDRSTIADLVARMTRRGLVERTRHGGDRRRYVLTLTAAGRAELAALRPRVEGIELPLTTGLGEREREELRRLLRVVLEESSRRDASGDHGADHYSMLSDLT
jgi:DNA-binding MarR family transcriptional regulator